jgi:secreted Zn-dependent insulinase-like peptidase
VNKCCVKDLSSYSQSSIGNVTTLSDGSGVKFSISPWWKGRYIAGMSMQASLDASGVLSPHTHTHTHTHTQIDTHGKIPTNTLTYTHR